MAACIRKGAVSGSILVNIHDLHINRLLSGKARSFFVKSIARAWTVAGWDLKRAQRRVPSYNMGSENARWSESNLTN